MVSGPEVLLEGVVFGESPRWHDGRLWFSDWGAGQVIALDAGGGHEVMASVASFPMCIDFLPDGRLLVVDSAQRRLLRREPDGSLALHADLSRVLDKPWNDIVADGQGNAYVNSIGFEFPGEHFAPGLIVLVTHHGSVHRVAGDLAFPNGMAITPDGATLIVAESYANQLTAYDIGTDGGLGNRRVWAETPGDHPGTPARLAALREVAKDAGATVNQVVLAWLIGGEVPVIPLVGASSVGQLDESLAAVDLELTAGQRARLDAAG